jgi:hypothetical protein
MHLLPRRDLSKSAEMERFSAAGFTAAFLSSARNEIVGMLRVNRKNRSDGAARNEPVTWVRPRNWRNDMVANRCVLDGCLEDLDAQFPGLMKLDSDGFWYAIETRARRIERIADAGDLEYARRRIRQIVCNHGSMPG